MAISTEIPMDEIKSTLRAAGSEALAKAVVLGIDECAQIGKPLSQVQQIGLVRMAIMSYDSILEASNNLSISLELRRG